MILTKIAFGKYNGPRAEAEFLAEWYLGSLLQDGQLCHEYLLAWSKGTLIAYVKMAGPNAFHLRFHSDEGKSCLKRLTTALGQSPVWEIVDDNAPKKEITWKGSPFLYLFTHAFDSGPAVHRGNNGNPIPAYLLPIAQQIRQDIHGWQGSYRAHDVLWLYSGALETASYKETANPNSQLAKSGRTICRAIESGTGIPTYYFLHRFWGRSKGEENRKCPGCGRKWHQQMQSDRRAHTPFWNFEFRCDTCRLVSHVADSDDDERHARIGEYRSKPER
jgi:predicted  nucleic acid-binding Zn ribbon protein